MLSNFKDLSSAVRTLSLDMVEEANSGHPGAPLGLADIVTVLFAKFLKNCSNIPEWSNRDRFILSAGHASAMLYSLLYLLGYDDITLEDLKNFRQIDSKTAGHPERGFLKGIEVTTGPLGQGVANAVGYAIAEKRLKGEFGAELVNHKVFVIAGDGCLMEGISSEALSLAGHLKLDNLVLIYDKNNITIDGDLSMSDSTDVFLRLQSYGFHTIECDGHDYQGIENALKEAVAFSGKPVIIVANTKIGFSSSKFEGTSASHGAPFGKGEVESVKKGLDCPLEKFSLKGGVLEEWRKIGTEAFAEHYKKWLEKLESSKVKDKFLQRFASSNVPNFRNDAIKKVSEYPTGKATRVYSKMILSEVASKVSGLMCGSADLSTSNGVDFDSRVIFDAQNPSGNFVCYGIREHAMGAIMNGIAAYSKALVPVGSTFLVFADYMKAAIRLSSLMHLKMAYILTHDSVALGEDGPTHQPIEHIDSLRLIPSFYVLRPSEEFEVLESWDWFLNSKKPCAIILSRQGVVSWRKDCAKDLCFSVEGDNMVSKGGYCAMKFGDSSKSKRKIAFYATGAEVGLASNVARKISDSMQVETIVHSMPCIELFREQEKSYTDGVLLKGDDDVTRVFIEMSTASWCYEFRQDGDLIFNIANFGASGKANDVIEKYGLDEGSIIKRITSECF